VIVETADAVRELQPASSPRRARRGLGRAGPVAVIATALPILGSLSVVAIGPFAAVWLRAQGPAGVVIFTVVFILLGLFSLAPTYSTSLIAGWTFGFRAGFVAVMIGTVGGAVAGYVAARRLAADRVAATFAEHPKWELIRRALVDETVVKTLWLVFLLRLSPVLPFGTTNVLMATTGVKLSLYVIGTMLGLAPRLGLVALAAAGAERLDFNTAESWYLLAGGLVATAVLILVLAILGRRAVHRATRAKA
jgi:uncharacterized membrane protein YdjX (TVP38/TMEM64 family)